MYVADGERGFTVKAIREHSGVSLGSLYHHFGNMDGLFGALAERWLGQLLAQMAAALQQHPDAHGGVHAIVRTYLRFIREHRDAALFPHSSDADRRGMTRGKELRDAQEARLSPFAQWAQAHIASGELAPLSVPLPESLILGPVVGTARRWLSGVGDVDLYEAAEVLPERIWRSVSAQRA